MDRDKLLKSVKKSALVGALVDGGIATFEKRGAKAILRDMGCGLTTGAVGATVSSLYREYVNKKGMGNMLAGSTASVATRYAYRSAFGPQLKEPEEE